MNWSDTWQPEHTPATRSGGQGRVLRVRNRETGECGALKILHDHAQRDRERRFRLQAEVEALRLLDGRRVPRVLTSNTMDWEQNDVDLYAVLEWIDGCTLGEYIQRTGPLELTAGLDLALLLAKAVEELHELGIHHRDLKPDNIILQNGDPAKPVLVDFGQAWSSQQREGVEGFETEAGQEMGNRFLRLPEHAPGAAKRDPRSDITLLVGVLLFLLTGRAPRLLRDATDRPPHEVALDSFLPATRHDHRWSPLERFFRHGFQVSIESRIPSAATLTQTLTVIRDLPDNTNDLGAAMARLGETMLSDPDRINRERQALMEHFAQHFAEELNRHSGSLLAIGDRAREFVAADYAVSSRVRVKVSGTDVSVSIVHRTMFQDASFVCQYTVDADSPVQYYVGPSADPTALQAASSDAAPRALARAATILSDRMLARRQGSATSTGA